MTTQGMSRHTMRDQDPKGHGSYGWTAGWTASLIRHGGAAGAVIAVAGLFFDSPMVLAIGLLALFLATYTAVFTGNRSF